MEPVRWKGTLGSKVANNWIDGSTTLVMGSDASIWTVFIYTKIK